MEFKKLCVNGVSYGEPQPGDPNYEEDISEYKEVTNVDFRDAMFLNILKSKSGADYENIKNVLLFLAVCHTIITEKKDGELSYNASSPDELALINLARFVGFEYRGIDENEVITVAVGDTE